MATKSEAQKKAEKLAAEKGAAQSAPQLPATQAAALPSPVALPEGVKLVKRLTMPSLVLKAQNVTRVLNIVDPFRVSKVQGKKKPDGTYEEPATVCTVGDVTTGEMFTLLVPAVMKKELEDSYPDDSYVGRVFAVTNRGKREGKRHVDYDIGEVDVSALTKRANGG